MVQRWDEELPLSIPNSGEFDILDILFTVTALSFVTKLGDRAARLSSEAPFVSDFMVFIGYHVVILEIK